MRTKASVARLFSWRGGTFTPWHPVLRPPPRMRGCIDRLPVAQCIAPDLAAKGEFLSRRSPRMNTQTAATAGRLTPFRKGALAVGAGVVLGFSSFAASAVE